MAELTLAEWIARAESKIEDARTLLTQKQAESEQMREAWRTLDEQCRKLEERIAILKGAVADAKVKI